MSRLESKIEMLKNAIGYSNNSERHEIKVTNTEGKEEKYTIYCMYKVDNVYALAIIVNLHSKKSYLVDTNSLRTLIRNGYINNAVIYNDDKILSHKNKVKAGKAKDFVKMAIKSTQDDFKEIIDTLKEKFRYILVIDDTDITNVDFDRLLKCGAVFDLSGHLAAVIVENRKGRQIIDIIDYKRLCSLDYNIGTYSSRSMKNNKFASLPYVRLEDTADDKSYLDFELSIGKDGLSAFKHHHNGSYYVADISKISIEIATGLWGTSNVYYAIPKPEKFYTEKLFNSALTEMTYMDITRYSEQKYELAEYTEIDSEQAIYVLKSNYNKLKTGEYLQRFDGIKDATIRGLLEHKDAIRKAEKSKNKKETDKILELINKYKQGIDITNDIKKLDIRIMREDIVPISDLHAEYCTQALLSKKGTTMKDAKGKELMRIITPDELEDAYFALTDGLLV